MSILVLDVHFECFIHGLIYRMKTGKAGNSFQDVMFMCTGISNIHNNYVVLLFS